MQIEETAHPCQLLVAGRSEVDLFGDLLVLNNSNLQKLVVRVPQNTVWKVVVDVAIARDRCENADRICPADASQPPGDLAMLKPIETLIGRVGIIRKIRKKYGLEVCDQTTGIATGVVIQIVRSEKNFQIRGDVPQQLTANIELVGAVRFAADRNIFDERIAVVEVDRELRRKGVSDRASDIAPGLNGIVVAVAHLSFTGEVETWRQCVNDDRTSRHVAPEQRALRSTEDFDFAKVKQIRILVPESGGGYSVDERRHCVVPTGRIIVDQRAANGEV